VIDILPKKAKMTSHRYTGIVLSKAAAAVGTTKTLLLHNNAAPHISRATVQYLEGGKVQVLPHPPCRSDVVTRVTTSGF